MGQVRMQKVRTDGTSQRDQSLGWFMTARGEVREKTIGVV